MMFYNTPIKLEFNDDGLLVDGKKHPFSVRMLSELNEVLLGDFSGAEDKPIYLMYRDIVKKDNLRYDMTVIASRILGEEYSRTYGHTHPVAEDELTYPEVYQVLFGEARFILQKTNKDLSTDVSIVSAKEGEVVLIPPNYGHVTVNFSEENPLFLANIISNRFKSDYSQYKKNKGPAVFYTTSEIKYNTNYLVREIYQKSAEEINKKYNFECRDLLTEFYSSPQKFEFLEKPSVLFKEKSL
ncbi:glucose-6-phosphate isomerase [Candidatus Micrarchaeota archaeon]|nr:glucose-6-phosphate isomerase [Candidatus Micrarchaeota archaeon]